MIVVQQADEGDAEVNVDDVPTVGVADEGAADVNTGVVLTVVDEPSIPSPLPTTQPPPPSQDVPFASQVTTPPPSLIVQPPSPQQQLKPSQDAEISTDLLHNLVDTSDDTVMDDISKQERIISSMDADVDVTLKDVADILKEVAVDAEIEESANVQGSMQDNEVEPAELQEVVEVVTTTKLITKVVTAASATITAAAPTLTTAPTKSKDKGKGILVEVPKPLKKQAQIEQDEAYARELEAELNKTINWDDVIDQVQRKEKEDNAVMRYQALKRKPQNKAQARKNMMIYLRNMAGFKMDYFKGMKYDDIRPIFEKYFNSNVAFLEKTKEQMEEEDSRALKRISKSQENKATKKQKLDEEVAELKRHL
uniref:Uncharacterized protein n=1 Tax=Tanacetum cinerariifolium TaxID=118510 RepID=A0A6L2KMJ4_TANCI|nr:hypothetical protein [Tanacetum cinerariifolium]